ncbi:PAS domain-containing protein [Erythrobacter sp. NFXS35]|uniref:PAS domain-containing sensor histidine kinase n=1 Tax=Erythrobacter sp. NFXS35 TaxID=2818436 RepID=UPI0032DE6FA4
MAKHAAHSQQDDITHAQAWSGALAQAAKGSPLATVGTNSLAEGDPIVFVNDAFAAMTGAACDAVLNRPVVAVLAEYAEAAGLAGFRDALADGRSGSWRMRIVRADGAATPGIVFLSPVRDKGDRVVGHCINIVDPAAADAWPDERGGISPANYDKAPGFIAIAKGADHRFEYTNAAYRAFVRRDHLIGRTVAEALPEMAEQGVLDLLDEVYRTGAPFCGSDLPISVRDPATNCLERRWIDVLYQPLRDGSGAICGLFCEGQDVTDLHKVNRTLAALEMKMIHASRVNAMGTMAATLAHELNQPLTAITNYLAGARTEGERAPDVERLKTALDGIGEATRRASGILDHLRQLTRHRKPLREPFNLREAVAECMRLVGSSCRTAIGFDNRVPGDTIMIADRIKIQQVLINLLQNACEAMAEADPALATIAASADDRGITVCIADTGPGVTPEAKATMFSWTESLKREGMGIGLSICRTIVELYGGRIWLEHSGPEGSEFRFWLPWPAAAPPR